MLDTFNERLNRQSENERKMIHNIQSNLQMDMRHQSTPTIPPSDYYDDSTPVVESYLINPALVSDERLAKACDDRLTTMSRRTNYKNNQMVNQVVVAPHLRNQLKLKFNKLMHEHNEKSQEYLLSENRS